MGVAPAQPTIRIEGDAVVVVGEATEFKAVGRPQDADADAPVPAKWSAEPEDAVTLEAGGQSGKTVVGESVKLTATAKGVFTLRAEADGWTAGRITVAAIVAPAPSPGVAFVGRGYGTIIIAIVLLSIAGALAAVDALASEAVATLFGALAGYIFLKGARDADTGSSSGVQSGPASQSTNPPAS